MPSDRRLEPASRTETWIFRALIAVIALVPLPLASNRPLPMAVAACAIGILLAGWALRILAIRQAHPAPQGGLRGPAFLFGAVLVWIILQWLPLPAGVLSHPIWLEASAVLGEPLPRRITIDPAATLVAFTSLLTYGAVFWLTVQLATRPDFAATARLALVAIGSAYAAYGLFAFFGGTDWLLGQIGAPAQDALVSTFVNRNSFATFAGLSLLAAASIFLERIRHILALSRPLGQKIALLAEAIVLQSGWITAAVLTIALALFLTASRGGIMASLFALLALVLLQTQGRSGRGARRRSLALLLLVTVGIALTIGGTTFLERMQLLAAEANLRSAIFTTTAAAIGSTPWAGTGFGTFAQAIEAYRANDPNLFAIWAKAHNTYLESALELGLPAAIALHASIFWLALIAFKGVGRRRRGRAFPALGVAATLLVALHALVDFSLQIPAVAMLFAFMLGLAVAQSSPGGRKRGSESELRSK